MSQATYRGAKYDTEIRQNQIASNWLELIRSQIEKENKLKEAQLAMAMK